MATPILVAGSIMHTASTSSANDRRLLSGVPAGCTSPGGVAVSRCVVLSSTTVVPRPSVGRSVGAHLAPRWLGAHHANTQPLPCSRPPTGVRGGCHSGTTPGATAHADGCDQSGTKGVQPNVGRHTLTPAVLLRTLGERWVGGSVVVAIHRTDRPAGERVFGCWWCSSRGHSLGPLVEVCRGVEGGTGGREGRQATGLARGP